MLARQGKFQPSGRTAAFKADRAATVEGRSPPVPLDLMRLPIYREANDWTRMRLARAWGTPGGCRWCGKFNTKIFSFVFEPPGGASFFGNGEPAAQSAFPGMRRLKPPRGL